MSKTFCWRVENEIVEAMCFTWQRMKIVMEPALDDGLGAA
jgi:hypothetical protein